MFAQILVGERHIQTQFSFGTYKKHSMSVIVLIEKATFGQDSMNTIENSDDRKNTTRTRNQIRIINGRHPHYIR